MKRTVSVMSDLTEIERLGREVKRLKAALVDCYMHSSLTPGLGASRKVADIVYDLLGEELVKLVPERDREMRRLQDEK